MVRNCKRCGKVLNDARKLYCSNQCKLNKLTKVCPICKGQFKVSPSRSNSVYCSTKCYKISKSTPPLTCIECNKTFTVHVSRVKKGDPLKYCSRECYFIARNRGDYIQGHTIITCLNCGKKKEVRIARLNAAPNKFCSVECHNIYQSKKVSQTCIACGKVFDSPPSSVKRGYKHCSKKCALKTRTDKAKRNKVELKCKWCEKVFFLTPSRIARGDGSYCSAKCARKGKEQTYIEKICQDALIEFGFIPEVDFITQYQFPNSLYWLDFYLPKYNIDIETQGIYWHTKPGVVERDKKRKEFLEGKGVTVLEWWENDIRKNKIKDLVINELLPLTT